MKLEVKSLEYPIEIVNNKVRVGCKSIGSNDALKIAEFIKANIKERKLPEKFSILIPNLKIGRVVVEELLEKTNIRVHGESSEDSIRTFERCFNDTHEVYNINGNSLSGNMNSHSSEVYTINQLFDILNDITMLIK